MLDEGAVAAQAGPDTLLVEASQALAQYQAGIRTEEQEMHNLQQALARSEARLQENQEAQAATLPPQASSPAPSVWDSAAAAVRVMEGYGRCRRRPLDCRRRGPGSASGWYQRSIAN